MRNANLKRDGFTLIELLVVMGIILLMVTLAIVSVGSMLRSSRMSRAVGLIVAAMDEARTAAVTLRRSTKVDLTRMDVEGRLNRLSVVGPFFNDNFESYTPPSATNPDPTNGPNSLGWVCTSDKPYVDSDGTRCMVLVDKKSYWNVLARVNTTNQDDFETNIQGRVKFLRNSPRLAERTISVLAAIKDSSTSITDGYRMNLTFKPAAATSPGRNETSKVTLDTVGGSASWTAIGSSKDTLEIDENGKPSTTTDFVEGVWYRVSLSVKRVTNPNDTTKPYAIVAGKVWVDGQLEPWGWTVGPMKHETSPLSNGTGGFSADGGNALVDDVLFDARPIRLLPDGLRVDAMDPTIAAPSQAVNDDSPYNFPILFRPDGTASFKYVIRITDATTGDRRYVAIDQNTGRARLEHKVEDALAK
jgi:prepilin-type N-terminal cleavage/methylation domain-containing protein